MPHTDTVSGAQDPITADDICAMAGRLIGLHGAAARSVADFLAEEHRILGDGARETAWRAVGSVIADILDCSLLPIGPTVH